MPKEIHTEILIHATPDAVWNVLTGFDNYPQWNPFIRWVKGKVEPGKSIEVRLTPPGWKGMTLKPKVLRFDTNKELRWLGHLLIPGLFDGEHVFRLIDNRNGTTSFTQSESFRGLLVPLFKNMLEKNTRNGFIQMNEKLKELAGEKNIIPA